MTSETPKAKNDASQQELFVVLEEFFERVTGKGVEDFATFETFDQAIRGNASELTRRTPDALRFASDKLSKFYLPSDPSSYEAARNAAGLKFVLGGSSRFGERHFDSVRKMVLYADTILIPDPVLPWGEDPRDEERFKIPLLIQTIFTLLHLKPLVDAKLPYPALIVFPSFERSLENHDPSTQAMLERFIREIFSSKLGAEFVHPQEIGEFVTRNPEKFLSIVEARKLFVGPQVSPDRPLVDHISEYRKVIAEWRSTEEQNRTDAMSDSQLVLQGILERLGPQFHLLENSEELGANPMLCIPNQWHYYSLCATAFEDRLKQRGLLEPGTIAAVRSINQPDLDWLGNVPMADLVRLRSENENETFRRRLASLTSQLNQTTLEDLDKVTQEVSKEIAALLGEHSKNVRLQSEEFQTKYKIAAVGACVTLAAVVMPFLAPFGLPASAAAVGMGYAATKIDELSKKKQQAKSLLGVLAAAKDEKA